MDESGWASGLRCNFMKFDAEKKGGRPWPLIKELQSPLFQA